MVINSILGQVLPTEAIVATRAILWVNNHPIDSLGLGHVRYIHASE